jgi:hypothetical protein
MNNRIVEEITTISIYGDKNVSVATQISGELYYGYDKEVPLDCYCMSIEEDCILSRRKAKVGKGVKDALIRNAANLEKIDVLEMKLSSLVEEVKRYRNSKREDSRKAIQKYIETTMVSNEITLLIKQNNNRINTLTELLLSNSL